MATRPKRKGGKEKFSKKQVAAALVQANGCLSKTARVLAEKVGGTCSRTTVQNYLARHPELTNFVEEAREEAKDFAEYHVFEAIKAGDLKTCRWFLSQKGADRGYGVRQLNVSGTLTEERTTTVTLRFEDMDDVALAQFIAERRMERRGKLKVIDGTASRAGTDASA